MAFRLVRVTHHGGRCRNEGDASDEHNPCNTVKEYRDRNSVGDRREQAISEPEPGDKHDDQTDSADKACKPFRLAHRVTVIDTSTV